MDSKLASSIHDLEQTFSTRMQDYEDKLQKVTSGADPAHTDISSLARDYMEFKSFVLQTLKCIKNQIELISLGLDRHEMSMRKKVLLLHGMPEKPNERLSEVVHNLLLNQMKIEDIRVDNLDVCHRLGASQSKTRPVLVRFKNLEHRRLVWDNKTTLKGTGVTVSEFLTSTRHRVFMAARKHFGINSCWSTEGKIVVLTPDKTRRKVITMGELDILIGQFPSIDSTENSTGSTTSATAKAATPSKASSKIASKQAGKRTARR